MNGTATPIARERWVLFACIIASSMAFIDASAINIALPALQQEFRCSGAELLWIINGYGVPLAALVLLGGAAADRFGRKTALMAGIGLFAAASAACGLAPDARVLIAVRVIQGMGAAVMIPASLALLSANVPADRRGRAIGIWTACSVATTALGPVLGGILTWAEMWRYVFLINVPLALVALVVLHQQITEPAPANSSDPVDLLGSVAVLVSLAGLNHGLIEAAHYGFGEPIVMFSLAVGLAGLIVFVSTEVRSANPIVPPALFRNGDFRAVCLLTVAIYSSVYATTFFLSLNLIQVQSYNEAVAGLAQIPLLLVVIVVSPLVGRFVDRYGIRGPLFVGPFVAGFAFLWLAVPGVMAGPQEYWVQLLPPLAVLGLAMGITLSPLSTAVMNSIPAGREGLASGVNSTLTRLSSVLGIALLGPVALAVFQGALVRQIEPLKLDGPTQKELAREAWKLGAARPPANLPAEVRANIERGIGLAFVSAFRAVAIVSAGAVWLSAIAAATILGRRTIAESVP